MVFEDSTAKRCPMTMSEFGELGKEAQLDLLYDEGAFIGKLHAGDRIRLLYQLGAFYVELLYSHHRREIDSIRFSEETGILQPYLSQIRY
jgi:hypothetical protein